MGNKKKKKATFPTLNQTSHTTTSRISISKVENSFLHHFGNRKNKQGSIGQQDYGIVVMQEVISWRWIPIKSRSCLQSRKCKLDSTAQGLLSHAKPSAVNSESSKKAKLFRAARKRARKLMNEEDISFEKAILRIKDKTNIFKKKGKRLQTKRLYIHRSHP